MVKLTRKVPSVFGRPNSPSCVCQTFTICSPILFERATESIYYADWQVHRVFIQVPIQVLVGKGLESFKEFPTAGQGGKLYRRRCDGMVAKIVHPGLLRLHAGLFRRLRAMLATRRDSQFLRRFSQLLEEIEHFCGCGQQEVAKIVQCGEALAEKNWTKVWSVQNIDGQALKDLMWSAFLLWFL